MSYDAFLNPQFKNSYQLRSEQLLQDILAALQMRIETVELELNVITGRAPGTNDRSELKAAQEAFDKQSATVAALSSRVEELTGQLRDRDDQLRECEQKLGLAVRALAEARNNRTPLYVYGIDWPPTVTTGNTTNLPAPMGVKPGPAE